MAVRDILASGASAAPSGAGPPSVGVRRLCRPALSCDGQRFIVEDLGVHVLDVARFCSATFWASRPGSPASTRTSPARTSRP
ncbi:hypothetical protein F2981_24225 (plasmid) [Sinorhizobium meliloti]|nr:hypothetical protein [Sinorhizobium meliloti]